jgi:hypothetical protein
VSGERKYTVRHYRDGDKEVVWVGDDRGSPNTGPFELGFTRHVSLKWRWYHLHSPAHRLAVTMEKAQGYADALNHAEMYINHEREIGIRS